MLDSSLYKFANVTHLPTYKNIFLKKEKAGFLVGFVIILYRLVRRWILSQSFLNQLITRSEWVSLYKKQSGGLFL